ncbi:MAG: ATP-grasp domain-containing protein, partial [Ralstonia sp.]
MMFRKLLIANRGEIAIRIARAAATVGLPSVAIYSEDDRDALHPRRADEAVPLPGSGPRAYLEGEAILAAARAVGADAIHPGYGFLSENAAFARQCAQASVQFIGPSPRVLALFGDKARARALAHEAGIPIVNGTRGATSLEDAQAFFAALPPSHGMMIKAVAGGGGRGMRAVHDALAIAEAHARCVSEATAAFGSGDVYVEALVPTPRHIEIQIVADAHGNVSHLGERECSLQRRHQKLVEIAPSPALDDALRARIADAAVTLARAAGYCGIGTFEFLVEGAGTPHATYYFMETNPRVQVEHTVTEMVTGIDLVTTQLALAQGASLTELGLAQPVTPRGQAIQVRINAETLDASGQPHPSTGMLSAFEPPNGPGVRVDTCGYVGYRPNPRFDSLLAKLIVHAPHGTYAQALAQTYRALCEFRIEGLATNRRLLQDLLCDDAVRANAVHTQFLDGKLADLANTNGDAHPALHVASGAVADTESAEVFATDLPDDAELLTAPMDGALIQITVEAGASVARGEVLAVIEAMKMEHVVIAPAAGAVLQVCAQPGATVREGQPLVVLRPSDAQHDTTAADDEVDLDHIRPDLRAVIDRHAFGLDENRPDAVARRRKTGQRTARENINALCDAGSFIEYGALAIAAQRKRRTVDDLIRATPADGIVTGIGTVNGTYFPDQDARCMVLAYDYTVLAGTQGTFSHKKTDRMLSLAQQWQLPVVLFAEGGGGRPGDTD